MKDGSLARARDLYQMLATTEPQNPLHMQNYQQVMGRMEGESPAIGITAEEGAVIVEELEAVSYTHLDVYKRQLQSHARRRHGRFAAGMPSAYYDHLEMFVKGLHLRFQDPQPRRAYGLVNCSNVPRPGFAL